ncbi:MAG: ATP phosphoribosyltransferase regulatory subunit [Gammaproteobacteria bacterium]
MAKFFRMPDHISDLPPPAAARLERARRAALDFLLAHDYALHIPALAEYAETLGGGDETLQLDIFKMTDTLSGRTLGIRADHTPQTARFDAARGGDAPRRLCYCGPALRTRPPQPWKRREIMQLGAEIFNLPPPAAEWEIIRLAAGALAAAGIRDIAIDIGHAGLVNLLLGGFAPARRAALCRHVARRDVAVLQEKAGDAAKPLADLLRADGEDAAEEARRIVAAAGMDAGAMPDELAEIAALLRAEGFDVRINFAEIGGYGYHTGAAFSIYGDSFLAARGGRYDRPGFRPAAGFGVDLREIVAHLPPAEEPPPAVACRPAARDPSWREAVAGLREQNRRLRFTAADETPPPPFLEKIGGAWKVRES